MWQAYVLLVSIACIVASPAFGHGLGLDTLTAQVDGSTYEITAQLPDRFDDRDKRLVISILGDAPDAPDMVLRLQVVHGGQQILDDTFLAPGGMLYVDIVTGEGEVRMEETAGPATLTGPVFGVGGLYTILLQVESINGRAIHDDTIHTLDLLVQDTMQHTVASLDGDQISFTTKSYFDNVVGFTYDRDSVVEFHMPFDWTAGRVSHIPVLHMEVHFSKDLAEFMARGYSGRINGVDLFRSSVTVDDFSISTERTVHFVLLQDHINLIKTQMDRPGGQLPDTMTFTLEKAPDIRSQMSAFTPNGDYQVDMTWEPEYILPDQNTKFIFTIRDAYTGETLRNSEYDFILEKDDRIIHRDAGMATVGGDFKDYTFSEEQAGTAAVRIENIRGTDQYVEFTFAVAPEFQTLAALVLAAGVAVSATLARFGTGPFQYRRA